MGCKSTWLPVGEGWGDDCKDAGGSATHGAVAEENKNNHLYPLIPTFSLKGEGAGTCVDTYGQGCLHGAYNFVASICQGIKNQVLVHVISLGCELATAIGSLGQFLPFSFSAELQIIRTSDTT